MFPHIIEETIFGRFTFSPVKLAVNKCFFFVQMMPNSNSDYKSLQKIQSFIFVAKECNKSTLSVLVCMCVSVCVCLCVCERERERERVKLDKGLSRGLEHVTRGPLVARQLWLNGQRRRHNLMHSKV